MKAARPSTHWLRSAIVTAVVLAGLAVLWVVLIGPAVLILLSPR